MKSFPSAQHASPCPGALRTGRGCHGHTIRPRQHGRTPCKCPHISFVGLIAGSFIFRSGIGRLGRLQSSHTRLAGVSDGATWSVKSTIKLACVSYLDGIVEGGNTLKTRCHSIVRVDRKGHTGFGVAGKVESQAGGPKVWLPRGSDGIRRLWENAGSAAMADRGDGQLSSELRRRVELGICIYLRSIEFFLCTKRYWFQSPQVPQGWTMGQNVNQQN